MKYMKSFFLFLVLMVIVSMSMGCRRTIHYDSRLTQADSIMVNQPDSALRLLEAIDGRQLATEGDRAYHALLLSQARYRCYVVASSDSLINIALNYYQHHDNEREKLTRVHIYKGGVMEELGQPEEAMEHFKRALTITAPDDYFNQGYARLRIGTIYQYNLVSDSSDIVYLNDALHCFEQVPDSFYIMTAAKALGISFYKSNKDSSLLYLKRAKKLAVLLKNKYVMFDVMGRIANIMMLNDNVHDIREAKNIAFSILNDEESENFDDRDNLLLIAAYTLAKQHEPDSAAYYLEQVEKKTLSDALILFWNRCSAEIALSKGDIDGYQHYFEQADYIGDSIESNIMQLQLREVEAKYDNEALKYENLRFKSMLWLSLLGSLLALAILAIAILMIYRKSAQRKQQLKDREDTIERLYSDMVRLESQLTDNEAMSDGLKQTIRHQIDTFTHLVEQYRTKFTQDPKQFGILFKKTYDIYQPDGSFWQEIRHYVDVTCEGIITQTIETFPVLAERDVRFLCLCCCNLPTTVIMACMGYNDIHSVYNKKRRLIQTLGSSNALREHIDKYLLPATDSKS